MALTKIDDRGVTYPLDLLDNEKIRFGTGSDSDIFHDGSNMYLTNTAGSIYIQGKAGENSLKATPDGNVELFYDNSKKAQTYANGLEVIGNLYMQTGGQYLSDNVKINIGNSADLEIYHDGESRIKNVGTSSSLYLQTHRGGLINEAASEWGVLFEQNSAVKLFYDGSQKLETTSAGVKATGSFFVDDGSNTGNRVSIGTGNDLRIFHNGSASAIENVANPLYIKSDTIYFQTGDGDDNHAKFLHDGAVELYYDNAKVFYTQEYGGTFKRPSGGATVLEVIGCEGNNAELQLRADDGDDEHDLVKLVASDSSGLYIQTRDTSAWKTNARFINGGAVELYYDDSKKLNTSSNGVRVGDNLFSYNSNFEVSHSSNQRTATFICNYNTSGAEVLRTVNRDNADNTSSYHYIATRHGHSDKVFIYGNGNIVNSNNSFGQMSDQKLKENIVDAKSQWDDVKNIKIRNFNFKESTGQSTHKQIGVIAQEVEAISPGCVYETPDRDVVNDKQLETKSKVVQYSVLHMKAFKALQEAMAKIEALEAEVAALKAK